MILIFLIPISPIPRFLLCTIIYLRTDAFNVGFRFIMSGLVAYSKIGGILLKNSSLDGVPLVDGFLYGYTFRTPRGKNPSRRKYIIAQAWCSIKKERCLMFISDRPCSNFQTLPAKLNPNLWGGDPSSLTVFKTSQVVFRACGNYWFRPCLVTSDLRIRPTRASKRTVFTIMLRGRRSKNSRYLYSITHQPVSRAKPVSNITHPYFSSTISII